MTADDSKRSARQRVGRVVRLIPAAALLVILSWLLFGKLGFFLTVQKSGGWTDQTDVVDFSPRDVGVLTNLSEGEVENVILLIADGLGFAHVTAARSQLAGVNGLLSFERFPVRAWLETHAASSVYSDSASTATALASGRKTAPGRVGVDAAGRGLPSIFRAAEAAGRATGWVTDSYFFDATPAAFATRVGDRRDYDEIVGQIAAGASALVIGETLGEYPRGEKGRARLVHLFESAGFSVATSWEEAISAPVGEDSRLAAFFPPGTIADDGMEPKLTDLFDLALERLAATAGGFVLLVEVEDPDTGAHNADFRQVVRGVRHLDVLASKAGDFARQRGRTLVVVMSDHETGGLTLITGGPDDRLGIRWATTNHSGAPVPLYAYGPGAEALTAVRDNTDVAPIVARLAGLDLAGEPGQPPPESRIGSLGGSD